MLRSAVRYCLSMCGAIGRNRNLRSTALLCTTLCENEHDAATVGTSKENRCLGSIGQWASGPESWVPMGPTSQKKMFGRIWLEQKLTSDRQ